MPIRSNFLAPRTSRATCHGPILPFSDRHSGVQSGIDMHSPAGSPSISASSHQSGSSSGFIGAHTSANSSAVNSWNSHSPAKPSLKTARNVSSSSRQRLRSNGRTVAAG
jgi:hypothetical protein